MLADIILLLINAFSFFFVLVLLLRFFMQWQRISFRTQLGQFVILTTDWILRPLRRIIPGLFGLDVASLLLAWFVQTLAVCIKLMLFQKGGLFLPEAFGLGAIELCQNIIWLITVVVLVAVVLSWVNPRAPMAPVINMFADPFLRPFRRIIPPIANIDLSPLVLLFVLQAISIVLQRLLLQISPFLT